MRWLRSALIVVPLLTATLAGAAGARSYPCYRLAATPVLDGLLDDAVWQSLPEARGFYTLKQPGYAVRKPTAFRLGWTPEGLYVAVRCREPFSRLIHALTNDGEPLWDDDSVELFVAPAGADYGQFIANTVGARWNGRQSKGEQALGPWTARAHVGSDDWTLEMHLPFSVLGRSPAAGEAWTFNLARNVLGGPAHERFSSWAAVQQGFGDAANFAGLVFKDAPVAAEVAVAETQMATDFRAFVQAQATGNLIANGSFEDGLRGWGLRDSGRIVVDPATATLGSASVRLDGSGGISAFVNASQVLQLKPATKYILRADIKRSAFGSGTISVDVIERDRKDVEWTYHRCGDRPGAGAAVNAWGHYELRFETSPKLLDAMLMLYNIQSGATAWYDGVELVEDDGVESGGGVLASTPIRLEVEARDAVVKLLVNGEAIAMLPGQPLLARIREGITVFAIDAQAQGPNPGVKVRLAGDPLTDRRWRASAQETPGWVTRDFDDGLWPSAAGDAQGFLWVSGGAPRALLRQALLWNAGHDGPDRCINPLIKEWGISEGAMENLSLMLYSPFPFALENYEFILDVPKEFRLLDILHETGRSQHNVRPAGVATEAAEHDGQEYTRYRIAEPETSVAADRISGQFLPLFLETWPGPERTTKWYYRRLARGTSPNSNRQSPCAFCRRSTVASVSRSWSPNTALSPVPVTTPAHGSRRSTTNSICVRRSRPGSIPGSGQPPRRLTRSYRPADASSSGPITHSMA